MKISIVIPTFNNLKYLKFFLKSVKNNSVYNHQIILHINDGSDGTLNFAKKNDLSFTKTPKNIGLCSSLNKAAMLVDTNYILYAHDDMFFCKKWDLYLENEIKKLSNNLFYLTGTNVSINSGLINLDCGSSPENFNEAKFNKFCEKDLSKDLQGSHLAPHLIHKDLWNNIGGFSKEFNPGDGSDPDFCMKLWKKNVRVFKTISKFKVYHFSSVTSRKGQIRLNDGTKTFTLKYGFNPRFFRKYYLKGNNLNVYNGPLNDSRMNFIMLIDLIVNKLKFIYYKF